MIVVLALCAVPGMAATITVTSLADDGSPGTLRSAIGIAVSGDIIQFSVSGTITLDCATFGFLEIRKNLTISGPGAASLAVSGNHACRVFVIDSGITVTLSGLTIENSFNDDPGRAGGILNNGGTLTVSNCRLSGNSANTGGAIFNDGNLTVNNSTFLGNTAPFDGSAILNRGVASVSNSTLSGNFGSLFGSGGDGIFNQGTLTLSNSTVSDNSTNSGLGAGIYNTGTLTVSNSAISGNSTYSGLGAGIYNAGALTVSNGTLSSNSSISLGGGGGIYNVFGGKLTMNNSTLSGNTADDFGTGGGIANYGTAAVSNSTLSDNSAGYGGGIANSGTLTVKGTILANSSAGGNCSGAATSDGYNLSDDGSCTSSFTQTGDLNNTAAGLDPNGLQNNGGPTKTIALVAGSAAIDAIPTNSCTDVAGNPVTTDQRGVPRPQGPACDIGSFEYTIPFARFASRLNIVAGPPPGFTLDAAFTLSADNSAIFPLTRPVTLIVGSYAVTVPATSFNLVTTGGKSSYVFSGTINGITLSEQISLMGKNRYFFTASATGVTPATSNPVSVMLLIGSNSGTDSVKAKF